MQRFLSDISIGRHRAYLSDMEARYRILRKDAPGLPDLSEDFCTRRRAFSGCFRARALYTDIFLHRMFFSCFTGHCNAPKDARKIEKISAFLSGVYRAALLAQGDFLLLSADGRGRLSLSSGRDVVFALCRERPLVCLDLAEHVYCYDYGFDKRGYLRAALSNLDLSLISEYVPS